MKGQTESLQPRRLTQIVGFLRREGLVVVVAGLYLWAFVADRHSALRALATGGRVFLSVVLIIVAVFGILGLFQVWVDKKKVAARLGERAGVGTVVLSAAFGTVLVGPVYVVFPLLKAVREHGARWAVVTAILAAWAVKIPMVPLEVEFLGWRFALVRTVLTFAGAVVMGLLVERMMIWWSPDPRQIQISAEGVGAAEEPRG
ncbi:MAG: permease [Thermoleophilia bacterium]|nr:permease [Thermoleophilia bacterium]